MKARVKEVNAVTQMLTTTDNYTTDRDNGVDKTQGTLPGGVF